MPVSISQLFTDKIFFKYVASGAIVSVGELTFFALMIYQWSWDYLRASAVIFIFGLIASFILRKKWVFCHKGCYRDREQLMLYSAIFLISTGLDLLIMYGLVEKARVGEVTAQIISLIVIGLFTFVANKTVTFRPLPTKELTLTNYFEHKPE